MESEILLHLNIYLSQSEHIKNKVDNYFSYWEPEEPPVLLLFSTIGRAIANHLGSLQNDTKLLVFQHIEDGISSGNPKLSTMIATGLIESLVSASDHNEETWNEILSLLRPESKKHAVAWRSFGS